MRIRAGKSTHGRSPSAGPGAAGGQAALSALGLLYGICVWLQFLLAAMLLRAGAAADAGAVASARPGQRGLARLALRWPACGSTSAASSQLPQPCIVVANHASYLDGVVLRATLPPCFSFVIKREMSSVPLAGTLLRRIGAEFVERGDRVRGARDARRLLRNAARGQALVFFPEGTFSTDVGLLRFHIGAFAAAVRADLPVVPIAIRGTRHCLPPGSIWPRPGTIEIEALRSAARAACSADGGHRRRPMRPRCCATQPAAHCSLRAGRAGSGRRAAPHRLMPPSLRELLRSANSPRTAIEADAAQSAAIEHLEALRARLLAQRTRGLGSRLRQSLSPQRDGGARHRAACICGAASAAARPG